MREGREGREGRAHRRSWTAESGSMGPGVLGPHGPAGLVSPQGPTGPVSPQRPGLVSPQGSTGPVSPQKDKLSVRTSQRCSVMSDMSVDEFLTPPTSPMSLEMSADTSQPVWDPTSPKNWTVNPIYDSDSRTSKQAESQPNSFNGANRGSFRQKAEPEVTDNYIDLQDFPELDQAPDNTLIKPSKLRESMKKRMKGGRFADKDNTKTGDSNNNVKMDVITVTESLPVLSKNESDLKHGAKEVRASPYDNVESELSESQSNGGYLAQALVEDFAPDNTLLTPSKLRESIRRKQQRASTPEPKDEASVSACFSFLAPYRVGKQAVSSTLHA